MSRSLSASGGPKSLRVKVNSALLNLFTASTGWAASLTLILHLLYRDVVTHFSLLWNGGACCSSVAGVYGGCLRYFINQILSLRVGRLQESDGKQKCFTESCGCHFRQKSLSELTVCPSGSLEQCLTAMIKLDFRCFTDLYTSTAWHFRGKYYILYTSYFTTFI